MPRGDTDTERPRRSSASPVAPTIARIAEVEDAIGMFDSESGDDAAQRTPPPTGYRAAVPEEIHPAGQRGTGILIGASVMLLVTLLGVAFTINRRHPSPRPPLDLTPPSQSLASGNRPSEVAGAPADPPPAESPANPAARIVPPAVTQETPTAADRPARKVIAPDAGAERRKPTARPPAAAIDAAAAPAPPVNEPVPPAAVVEAIPVPAPMPLAAGPAALDGVVAPTVPPPPPPPPTPTVNLDPLSGDRAAIRRTLDVYRESYSALDASAVSMIWVGLDTRALQRAFSTLSRQDLAFNHCDRDISAARNRARASCTGVLNYVRRIGSADEHQRQMSWAIDLVRSSDRWLIENVTAR
jgi:hypothetical protein